MPPKAAPRKKRANNTRLSNNVNHISLDHFPVWRGVTWNKKLYDAKEIVQALKKYPNAFTKVPHTQKPLTPNQVKAAMAVMGRVPVGNGGTRYTNYESRRAGKRWG